MPRPIASCLAILNFALHIAASSTTDTDSTAAAETALEEFTNAYMKHQPTYATTPTCGDIKGKYQNASCCDSTAASPAEDTCSKLCTSHSCTISFPQSLVAQKKENFKDPGNCAGHFMNSYTLTLKHGESCQPICQDGYEMDPVYYRFECRHGMTLRYPTCRPIAMTSDADPLATQFDWVHQLGAAASSECVDTTDYYAIHHAVTKYMNGCYGDCTCAGKAHLCTMPELKTVCKKTCGNCASDPDLDLSKASQMAMVSVTETCKDVCGKLNGHFSCDVDKTNRVLKTFETDLAYRSSFGAPSVCDHWSWLAKSGKLNNSSLVPLMVNKDGQKFVSPTERQTPSEPSYSNSSTDMIAFTYYEKADYVEDTYASRRTQCTDADGTFKQYAADICKSPYYLAGLPYNPQRTTGPQLICHDLRYDFHNNVNFKGIPGNFPYVHVNSGYCDFKLPEVNRHLVTPFAPWDITDSETTAPIQRRKSRPMAEGAKKAYKTCVCTPP